MIKRYILTAGVVICVIIIGVLSYTIYDTNRSLSCTDECPVSVGMTYDEAVAILGEPIYTDQLYEYARFDFDNGRSLVIWYRELSEDDPTLYIYRYGYIDTLTVRNPDSWWTYPPTE